ncbi:MAG: hypothetical protein AAB944_00540, partial [Patescibacteria group bacterium]
MGILEILARKNIIKEENIPSIRRKAGGVGQSVEQVLAEMGVLASDILESKGEYLNVPIYSIGDGEVKSNILEYIPEESAAHYRFVPIGVKDGVLEVGITDPDNIEARDALTFISSKVHMPFRIFLISGEDFEKVLNMYKGLSHEV